MRYDLIIFDIDGTLWNACATSAEGFNRALRALGIMKKVSATDIERHSGLPYEQFIGGLIGDLLQHHPALHSLLNVHERQAIEKLGGSLYDGVYDGLKALHATAKIFLVSNCQDWYLDRFIAHANLTSILSGSNCFGRCQLPKAQMLRAIVEDHPGATAVYVGDTAGDLQAAADASIDFIGATYGFGDVSGAAVTRGSLWEIVDFLLAGADHSPRTEVRG